MLKLFVVLGALLLMMPVAYADISAATVKPITTGSSPGINVSLSNGDSYEMTYSYLLLIATFHSQSSDNENSAMVVFGADLQQQNWTIAKTGQSGSLAYVYESNITLTPTTKSPLGYGNQSFMSPSSVPTSLANKLFPRVEMKVVITQSSKTDSIAVVNQTGGYGNTTYKNLSISTLTIDNYINVTYFPTGSMELPMLNYGHFEQEYRIELLQGISAHVSGQVPMFQRFNGTANPMSSRVIPVSGFALTRSGTPGNPQGIFWWPSNYTTDDEVQVVQPYFLKTFTGIDLGFQYHGNSTSSIVQDPYFSILNANLNGKMINQKLEQAYQEIVDNLALFGSGILFGVVLIGMSYSVYRRRRV